MSAMAPRIIDRPCRLTSPAPLETKVSPSVASATLGAPPKRPARLRGATTSPMSAKAMTTTPPMTKRSSSSAPTGAPPELTRQQEGPQRVDCCDDRRAVVECGCTHRANEPGGCQSQADAVWHSHHRQVLADQPNRLPRE